MASQDHGISIPSVATDEVDFPTEKGEIETETAGPMEAIATVEEGDDHNVAGPNKRPKHSSTAPAPMTSNESPVSDKPPSNRTVSNVMMNVESLLTAIMETIAFSTNFNYSKLLESSISTHRSLVELGHFMELGSVSNDTQTSSSAKQFITEKSRKEFISYGRKFWNLLQKNPEIFCDYVNSPDPGSSSQSTANKNVDKNTLDTDRAGSSGVIRSIAGRLILMEKLSTASCATDMCISTPTLIQKSISNEDRLPFATLEEMEFGIKCFARAGKAVLNHAFASYPDAAYSTLSLVVCFWEGMQALATKEKENATIQSHLINCTEEVIDSQVLLPDAACLQKARYDDNKCRSEQDQSDKIVTYLKRLEDFLSRQIPPLPSDCKKGDSDATVSSLLAMQRHLPILARTSYKHGNRFARLSKFEHSREALRIALTATDRCLARISIHMKENTTKSFRNGFQRSLQIQQQEMLVVSKQSLYVLSHVCNKEKMIGEAHKCLDRIDLYIDEQQKRDEELFTKTMNDLVETDSTNIQSSSSPSDLALEGPKKKDMYDIKSRAQLVRAKARCGEIAERINLAFSKIMLINGSTSSVVPEEDQNSFNIHFEQLVQLSTTINSNESAVGVGDKYLNQTPLNQDNENTMGLVYVAARTIFMHRIRQMSLNDGVIIKDPFTSLLRAYPLDNERYLFVLLEHLNSLVVAIQSSKNEKFSSQVLVEIEQQSRSVGRDFILKLKSMMVPVFEDAKNSRSMSDSFLLPQDLNSNHEKLMEASREFFTRAVAFHHHLNDEHSKTIEWCDMLIEVLFLSQTKDDSVNHNPCNQDLLSKEKWDKTLSGIMAIKALALTMSSHYGSGLKTAREAWGKCGTEVGNVVTLFFCSIRYEASSNQKSKDLDINHNILLELDTCTSQFLSLCKINESNIPCEIKLLDVFPVMCNTCLQHQNGFSKDLLLGLEKRWLELLIKSLCSSFSRRKGDVVEIENIYSKEQNVFDILCMFLVNFEHVLAMALEQNEYNFLDQRCQNLDSILEGVLYLLVIVRDNILSEKNQEDPFVSMEEYGENGNCTLLFEIPVVKRSIGSPKQCIWIAEQIWNIATQITDNMSGPLPQIMKKKAAQLFSKAHDFALFSEEEVNLKLTKGYLACESFAALSRESEILTLSSSMDKATELCSEFSYQCLILSIAYDLDDIETQDGGEIEDKSCTKYDQRLRVIKNYLRGAIAETKELDTSTTKEADESLIWLSLTYLVAKGDDRICIDSLTNGGFLDRMNNELKIDSSQGAADDKSKTALEHVMKIAERSLEKNMPETAFQLFAICTMKMLQYRIKTLRGAKSKSVGSIQKHMLILSRTVDEVVNIFDVVYQTLKGHSVSCKSPESLNSPYELNEVDYFTIEAHNRAVGLMHIGDYNNAERLLMIAVNLVSFSGKEVVTYGGEIRRTHRCVVDHCGVGGGILSMSQKNMLQLFQD